MTMFLFQKRFNASFNLLQRLSPFGTFQFRGYRPSNKKLLGRQLPEAKKSLHSPRWSIYIVPAALLVIAGRAMFVHYNDESRAKLEGSYQGTGNEGSIINGPAIGGPFRLIDTNYHIVTDSDLRGDWILIYFGYTSSPDVGPEEVEKMAKAVDMLESEQKLKIKQVFISIDPERDSPSQLRAYLKEFDPRITGLTGSISAIKHTLWEYRVYFKKVDEDGQDYLIQSSHNMYLMNPDMELVRCFGVEYDAEQLCEGILKEMNRASISDKQAHHGLGCIL